jgi:hypothetical protein
MINNTKQLELNAARYLWIKAQKSLRLETDGLLWFRENQEKFYPSHRLSVRGTGFHGVEHLDDLIDQAMEMYPIELVDNG